MRRIRQRGLVVSLGGDMTILETQGADPIGTEPRQAVETYRHLRMLLIALPAFLLVTTVIGGVVLGDFADSISANYASPLRDVFVGSLAAIGALLVVYRGTGWRRRSGRSASSRRGRMPE